MKIEHIRTVEIQGVIEVVTGLHIGGGRDTVEIGGVDNPVIKHPHTQQPFIPGSSLKGKLRSLLEWALGKIRDDGKPWGYDGDVDGLQNDEVLRIFGTTHKEWEAGPTRLIVRDAALASEWVDRMTGRGLPLTEDKTEVVIDRIQGKAANTGPRTMERVPGGARFQLDMVFRLHSVNGDSTVDLGCLNRVLEALKLLEKDCLGGSGSRGYGQVKISELRVDGRDIQEKFDAMRSVQKAQAQAIVTL